MSGRSYFKLVIQWVGGHGSSPHKAHDAIVAGAYFVTTAQTIVSRSINPAELGVISIGSFDGKGTFNVIKDRVVIEGDIRYMTDETKKIIEKELEGIVKGTEHAFEVDCDLTIVSDYPPLYNDPEMTELVKRTLESVNDPDIKNVVACPMMSPSDDFAYYLEKIPGCYFYIASTPKGVKKPYFNHHPKFDIDEDALLVAAKSVAYVVCEYFGLK